MQMSLQKREISRTLGQDLKEAISLVKRHDYERMLKHAHDLMGLGAIEHQVRMDSRLTRSERILLPSAVAGSRMPEDQAPIESQGDIV